MRQNSVAIFVFYDRCGIIDDYILYLLTEIKKVANEIIFVSQCELGISEKSKIDDIVSKIIIRNNTGYDAGAIKDVIINYITRDGIKKISQLILVNDSVYGPFYPLKKCFSQMNKYDFWGMTKNKGNKNISEHLQSYFLVIEERMLHSESFFDYWEKMPYLSEFKDVLNEYEFSFTQYFESLGFSWSAYVDTDDELMASNKLPINPYYQLLYNSLVEKKYPFIKKKPFSYNDKFLALDRFSRYSYLKAIKYIDENLDYDVQMIWDNLIRTYPASSLLYNCNLKIIVNDSLERIDKNNCALLLIDIPEAVKRKIVNEYLPNWPGLNILWHDSHGQEKSTCQFVDCYLRDSKDDYFICINGKDFEAKNRFYMDVESIFFSIIDGLALNANYIGLLCKKMDNDSRLGMLLPAVSTTGYKAFHGDYWNDNRIKQFNYMHEKYWSDVPIDHNEDIFPELGSCIIRTSILMTVPKEAMEEMVNLDEVLVSKLMILHAQNEGFYTGIVENSLHSSVEYMNMYYQLKTINKQLLKAFSFDDFFELNEGLRRIITDRSKIINFANQYRFIYVYGAGVIAKQIIPLLKNVKGVLVTNLKDNPVEICGKKVFEVNEISLEKDEGIIVAVSEKYKKEIENIIKATNLGKSYMII